MTMTNGTYSSGSIIYKRQAISYTLCSSYQVVKSSFSCLIFTTLDDVYFHCQQLFGYWKCCEIPPIIMSHLKYHQSKRCIINNQKGVIDFFCNFVIGTMPADALALLDARTPASMVMTEFVNHLV